MTSPGPAGLVGLLSAALKAAEDFLLELMLAGMIVISFGQIILRNVAGMGFAWGEAVMRHMVLWVTLLGAMRATRKYNHVTVDIVTAFLPPRLKAAARALTDLFSGSVCLTLAYASVTFVAADFQAGVKAFGLAPAWMFEMILPPGFLIISGRFFAFAARHLRLWWRGTPEELAAAFAQAEPAIGDQESVR